MATKKPRSKGEWFLKAVELKNKIRELQDQFKECKEYFEALADKELDGGIGKLEIIEIDGKGRGLKFSERKSSISKTKLKEQGVSETIIEQATGRYRQMDIY